MLETSRDRERQASGDYVYIYIYVDSEYLVGIGKKRT